MVEPTTVPTWLAAVLVLFSLFGTSLLVACAVAYVAGSLRKEPGAFTGEWS
jgi:hypothetical protein